MNCTIHRAGALAFTLLLASCAGTPAARHSEAARQDPARLAAQAQPFEAFMRHASTIDASFSGPAEVNQGLATGAAYEPRALASGMIAYAALAALEEPRFVSGVRAAARKDRGLAQRLAARPDLAVSLPGAPAAAARASAALWRQGDALGSGGRQVKSAAYSIQRQAWARAKVADPQGRLQRVKADAVYRPADGDRALLLRAVAQGGARSGARGPVIQRALALAALDVLGQSARGAALASEPKSGMCLRLAKLDFHQCLSAAGPYYEDIYCLGQHAMIDPGQCVKSAAEGRS